MDITLQREPTDVDTTFGSLTIDGTFECHTLEDAIREVDGEPVERWKVKNETAIPSGRYRVTTEASGRFGPGTLTINDVPGFESIRIHGGNTSSDTEGCVIVGGMVDRAARRISGAVSAGVLIALKRKVQTALDAGEDVWIDVRNP